MATVWTQVVDFLSGEVIANVGDELTPEIEGRVNWLAKEAETKMSDARIAANVYEAAGLADEADLAEQDWIYYAGEVKRLHMVVHMGGENV